MLTAVRLYCIYILMNVDRLGKKEKLSLAFDYEIVTVFSPAATEREGKEYM